MNSYLESLDTTETILFYIAVFFTIIFLIQLTITFFAGDADTDIDANSDGIISGDETNGEPAGGFIQYFSFRNIVSFFMGFGWSALGMIRSSGISDLTALFIGVFIGILFVFISMLPLKFLSKLQQDNSVTLENVLGMTAIVSISIPENMTGKGKVLVVYKDREWELMSVTYDKEKLSPGSLVKIEDVRNNGALLVVTAKDV